MIHLIKMLQPNPLIHLHYTESLCDLPMVTNPNDNKIRTSCCNLKTNLYQINTSQLLRSSFITNSLPRTLYCYQNMWNLPLSFGLQVSISPIIYFYSLYFSTGKSFRADLQLQTTIFSNSVEHRATALFEQSVPFALTHLQHLYFSIYNLSRSYRQLSEFSS